MTDQQPMSPEPCEHHWIHYGQPNHSPIRWIVKCSQCNQFKIEDLQEQVDVIEAAAEQRGAEETLAYLIEDYPAYASHEEIRAWIQARLDHVRNADQEGAQDG